jgi:hypothetical protein
MVLADGEAERLRLPWWRRGEALAMGGRTAEVGSRWWSCRRRGTAGCSADWKGEERSGRGARRSSSRP